MPPFALCVTLLLLLSFAARLSFFAPAAAQTQTKAQPQSREALYLKCRNAIFRKYGQSGAVYSIGSKYLVLPYTSGSRIDQCVANGGCVD
jgi:hypothetical protein